MKNNQTLKSLQKEHWTLSIVPQFLGIYMPSVENFVKVNTQKKDMRERERETFCCS